MVRLLSWLRGAVTARSGTGKSDCGDPARKWHLLSDGFWVVGSPVDPDDAVSDRNSGKFPERGAPPSSRRNAGSKQRISDRQREAYFRCTRPVAGHGNVPGAH